MRRSRTYRACNVKDVKVEALLAGREGQKAIVGADIGKEKVYLAIYWPDRSTSQPIVVKQREELNEAIALLKRLAKDRELVVAMESSGTYGNPFRYQCTQAGIEVLRVSSVASNRHAEVYDNVPSQHDGKDACVIAELAFMGKSAAWAWEEPDEQLSRLKAHRTMMDVALAETNQWRGRLEGWLGDHWPEATMALELDSNTLLQALLHYGSPAKLAADPEAAKRLGKWGGSSLQGKKVEAVIESAGQTRGVPVEVGDEYLIKQMAGKMLLALQEKAEHHEAIEQLGLEVPCVAFLAPVVGKATSTMVYLELGDLALYESSGALLKAAGLNLVERSSGQQQGMVHIGKRGSACIRRWLYLMALRHLRGEGAIAQWHERKVARDGGIKMKSVVAIMRKLLRALYHCRVTGEAFNESLVFQSPKARRHKRSRRRKAAVSAGVVS